MQQHRATSTAAKAPTTPFRPVRSPQKDLNLFSCCVCSIQLCICYMNVLCVLCVFWQHMPSCFVGRMSERLPHMLYTIRRVPLRSVRSDAYVKRAFRHTSEIIWMIYGLQKHPIFISLCVHSARLCVKVFTCKGRKTKQTRNGLKFLFTDFCTLTTNSSCVVIFLCVSSSDTTEDSGSFISSTPGLSKNK